MRAGEQPDPSARLSRALKADGPTTDRAVRAELLAALADATVYAAVSATATGEHTDEGTGLRAESGAELAVLLLEAPDGTRALPVFSDLDQLAAWRPGARPQRLTGAQACAAARDEGAVQLLLDPAGRAVALTAQELTSLAEGWVPVPGTSLATSTATGVVAAELSTPAQVDPDLVRALQAALGGERLRAARLLRRGDELLLGVAPRRPLDPAGLAALAHRLVTSMGPAMPEAGLGLMQVPVRGPGLTVLTRRFRRPGRGGC